MSAAAPLPPKLNPRKLASSAGSVAGETGLAGMRRLAEFLGRRPGELTGTARLEVDFAEDQQRRVTASGSVAAELPAICRVCQQDFMLTVQARVLVAVVSDPEAGDDLPAEVEPLLVEDDRLDVTAWVEDELILAVPVAPRCSRPECVGEADVPATLETARTQAPFAGLKGLMDDAADKDRQ